MAALIQTAADPRCAERVRLTRKEYTYTEEIPGLELWWTRVRTHADHKLENCHLYPKPAVHQHSCMQPTDKHLVQCMLEQDHQGEHATPVGFLASNTDKNAYIFWQAGVPGAREIRQPGSCPHLDHDSTTEDVCALFTDHPGVCAFERD